jgi:hypothetical protein
MTINQTLCHEYFSYDQIDDGIFIGTSMCCQSGFEKELLAKNIRADISLEELKVDDPVGVDYFLWLPTKNFDALSIEKLLLGIQTIEFLVSQKISSYIHCENGQGRSPMLYAAYLVKQGMEVTEAINHIQAKRKTIQLSQVQVDGLRAFQSSLKV